MKRYFGLHPLIQGGSLTLLKQLVLTYRLKSNTNESNVPHIVIVGTTSDSSTRILCPLKKLRIASCDLEQKISFIIDMDKHDVIEYYFYIYNYEQIDVLYSIKDVRSSIKDVIKGSKTTVQNDDCDIVRFFLVDSYPEDKATDVSIEDNYMLIFNHDVDSNTVDDNIFLWLYADKDYSVFSSASVMTGEDIFVYESIFSSASILNMNIQLDIDLTISSSAVVFGEVVNPLDISSAALFTGEVIGLVSLNSASIVTGEEIVEGGIFTASDTLEYLYFESIAIDFNGYASDTMEYEYDDDGIIT